MVREGWNTIDDDAGVLWREYSFGRGNATTFVYRAGDGLVVVSPAVGLEPREYDALAELGEVRALVASNALHTLGHAPWRARFPDAVSYCPSGSVSALEKKIPGVKFRRLSELQDAPGTRCMDMPGVPKGETFASVATAKGNVWFTGDILTNFQALPPPPLRWLFDWSDSGPGLRLFKLSTWIFVKDGRALRAWAEERLADAPPAIIVPAHGPAVEAPDLPALARAQIERL